MGQLDEQPLSLETAAVVIAGQDGTVTWASPAVRELLGHDPEALVGRRVEVLVPKEFIPRHRIGWKRVWAHNRMPPPKSPIMIPVVCGDGQVRRFASHLLPLHAPHGQLLAIAAIWVEPSDADTGLRNLE